jgi:hypothetical protein
MSNGPIALLKLEEYWYKDKKMVSSDIQRYKQPFQAGDVIEMTTHAPAPTYDQGWTRNVVFTHANGKAMAKKVDKF